MSTQDLNYLASKWSTTGSQVLSVLYRFDQDWYENLKYFIAYVREILTFWNAEEGCLTFSRNAAGANSFLYLQEQLTRGLDQLLKYDDQQSGNNNNSNNNNGGVIAEQIGRLIHVLQSSRVPAGIAQLQSILGQFVSDNMEYAIILWEENFVSLFAASLGLVFHPTAELWYIVKEIQYRYPNNQRQLQVVQQLMQLIPQNEYRSVEDSTQQIYMQHPTYSIRSQEDGGNNNGNNNRAYISYEDISNLQSNNNNTTSVQSYYTEPSSEQADQTFEQYTNTPTPPFDSNEQDQDEQENEEEEEEYMEPYESDIEQQDNQPTVQEEEEEDEDEQDQEDDEPDEEMANEDD